MVRPKLSLAVDLLPPVGDRGAGVISLFNEPAEHQGDSAMSIHTQLCSFKTADKAKMSIS
jgi:hypothetical protein